MIDDRVFRILRTNLNKMTLARLRREENDH